MLGITAQPTSLRIDPQKAMQPIGQPPNRLSIYANQPIVTPLAAPQLDEL